MTQETQTSSTTQSSPPPSPSTPPAAGSEGGSPPTPTQATRPDWLPETAWDAAKNTPNADLIKAAFEAHAAQTARAAARPEKAEGYALEFPKDYKLPDGYQIVESDPLLSWFRETAFKFGLPQEEFSQALQGYSELIVARDKAEIAKDEAEKKKLGANATARVTAAKTWLAGIVGADGAGQIMDRLVLASDVELLEKVQLAFSSQGGASINGKGRDSDPPPPPKTAAERIWPNGFSQAKGS